MTYGQARERNPLPDFDLYAELGIPLDAPVEVVERAWRAKVREAHPDRSSGPGESAATHRTARLNIAREWLTDPVRRARYDALRRSRVPAGPAFDASGIDPLGSWSRPPQRRGKVQPIAPGRRYVLVPLAIMALIAVVGIGTNVVTIVAFGLAFVTFLYFGLFAFVGVLYRVVTAAAARLRRIRS